jgi:methylenetetrahydrofolate reductase (NADPH)
MKIIDKLRTAIDEDRKFFSFEYFPPKTEAGVLNLYSRMERMSLFEPAFIDVTWGAGGTTAELTLELSVNAHNFFGMDAMMHLTCTDMPIQKLKHALQSAKEAGIRNILALRGDPSRGAESWEQCEDGFAHAAELVKFIRQEYGDYFGICVAGYPEGHIEAQSLEEDLKHLKTKVDAGADFIITQVFYDTSLFLDFVKRAREIGILVPIIPGIMPIQNYNAFRRMTSFCKTHVPEKIWKAIKPIRDDDAAVKQYGVDLAIEMSRELMSAGIPGIHIYTLNLEKSARLILEGLDLIAKNQGRKLPWKPSQVPRRQKEDVRPIFWANRPNSYLKRTSSWDEFPNGRWGDSTSPAYGSLHDYHLLNLSSGKAEERKHMWSENPLRPSDIFQVFANYIDGKIPKLPWSAGPLNLESLPILESLRRMNLSGFLTINSQPRVNGAPSTDSAVGWGSPGGYVYQKAYLEFFTSPANLRHLVKLTRQFPSITFHAINSKGISFTNCKTSDVVAVTWGVFPDSEIKQPTVVDRESFRVWKDEAFSLWLSEWASIYPKGSESHSLCHRIYNSYFLVNIVDNDFVNGDIFVFVDRLSEVSAQKNSSNDLTDSDVEFKIEEFS